MQSCGMLASFRGGVWWKEAGDRKHTVKAFISTVATLPFPLLSLQEVSELFPLYTPDTRHDGPLTGSPRVMEPADWGLQTDAVS